LASALPYPKCEKERHDVNAWLAETQFWQEKLSSCSFLNEVKISTLFQGDEPK